jgi:hypothetical protein
MWVSPESTRWSPTSTPASSTSTSCETAISPTAPSIGSIADFSRWPRTTPGPPVRQFRAKAKAAGLDPDVWFGNVEIIAAREIGRETVDYVSNIYKYYLVYLSVAAVRDSTGRDR